MSALKPLAAATRAVTAGVTLGLTVVMVLALAACSSPVVVVPIPDAPQFTPASSSTLPGRWVVADTYSSPDQPYLAFEHDGTWKGSDGCNNAKGTWSMDSSGALTTTSGPVTRIYCDGAPLPLYLIDATSAKFDGTTLTLVGHKSEELVKLKRPSSTESPAPGGTQVVVGLWTSVENGRSRLVKLSMADDGTVAGNDGCNDFTSTWRFAEDGTVSFGTLAITGRTCEGVVTWLSGAASAVLDGTTMVIRSKYGGQLGTLTYHGAA